MTAEATPSLLEVEEAALGSLSSPPAPAPKARQMAGTAYLLVTACGWALNWVVMKFLLQQWPPLFARGVAGCVAAIGLALIAAKARQSLVVPRAAMPRLLAAAFTNVFAWMGFGSLCMKWVSVSEGALLVYSMPLWATLLAWLILGTRPSVRGVLALLLGLAGLILLLSGRANALGGGQIAGVVLALAAAILFALGTVVNGRPLPLAPIASTAWQVGLGCLPMILIGLLFEHPNFGALTGLGVASMAYMTMFPMGVCYLTWFAALRRLTPSAASTGMLLVPILGTLAATAILGELLGLRVLGSMALTLCGVTLALKRG